MEMTLLERQQARFKWLQQQLNHNNYLNQNYPNTETCPMPRFQGLLDHQSVTSGDIVDWNKKNKPGLYMGNSDLIRYGSVCIAAGGGTKFLADKMGLTQAEAVTHPGEVDHCLSRSSSCQVGALEVEKMEEKVVEVGSGDVDVSLVEEMRSKHGGDVLNKRKAGLVEAEESKEKRTKGEIEVESQMQSTNQISAESSKENERSSAAQKQDYIHVRARRGQATDSHSLAERARREKISKKMKYLQDLVPGCNKITGRARMLDEIINYVQSLQRQVEFLSMKLATLTPRQELDIDTFSEKVLPAYVASFPASNLSPAIASLPRLLLNVVQQQATGIEPELPINPSEILQEITTSSSMFMPELCPDSSSCFSSFWDSNPQNLHKFGFHQG